MTPDILDDLAGAHPPGTPWSSSPEPRDPPRSERAEVVVRRMTASLSDVLDAAPTPPGLVYFSDELLCSRCDEPAGTDDEGENRGPMAQYSNGTDLEWLHPRCYADMMAQESCGGED